MMRSAKGFTLIELMVVVVIVATLAAIAIPSYSRYIQRGDLVEATNALATYRVQMEQWYQDNNTYADPTGANCGAPVPAGLTYFTVACALNGANAYVATATAQNGNAVTGAKYTINQQNQQSTLGLPNGWAAPPANNTTWIVR